MKSIYLGKRRWWRTRSRRTVVLQTNQMVPPHYRVRFIFGIYFSSFEIVFQAQLAALVFILCTYVVGLGYD
jgi:hypothetical protein